MGSRAWVSDGEQLRYNRLPLASIRKGILRYGNTAKDITKMILNSTAYDFEKQSKEGVVVLGKGYSAATFFLPEVTIVLPEVSGTIGDDGMAGISTYMPLFPGAIYRVTYNNVVYECKATRVNNTNYLGNLSLALSDSENTGEPFVLMPLNLTDTIVRGSTGVYTVKVEKLERKATITPDAAATISLKEYLYILGYTSYSEIPAWDEFARNIARVAKKNGYETSTINFKIVHEDSSKYSFAGKAVFGQCQSAKEFFRLLHDNISDDAHNTMLSEWLLEDGAVYAVCNLFSGYVKMPMILGRP